MSEQTLVVDTKASDIAALGDSARVRSGQTDRRDRVFNDV
jgi:hypothetical protein